MKTRTLLLLAVVCGLAILVAGSVQLLRVVGQENEVTQLVVGDTGVAGDATVVVDRAPDWQAATLTVPVTLGGVDDPAGLSGFRLVAAGATRPVSGGTCRGFTEAAAQCTLTFDNSGLEGSTRVLLFERASDRLRWEFVEQS